MNKVCQDYRAGVERCGGMYHREAEPLYLAAQYGDC